MVVKRSYIKHNSKPIYLPQDMRLIYGFPQPTSSKITVAVASFGGGLYGTFNNGKLVSGDIITYGKSIHVNPNVYFISVDGGINDTTDYESSCENTIDIEQIIASCPSNNLVIKLFVGTQNTSFQTMISTILQTSPDIISISWGCPEMDIIDDALATNELFKKATSMGINICVATGDNGSSDGTSYNNMCDFPSSSPYVIACGGTSLTCPTKQYDKRTIEKAWADGGGAVSHIFKKMTYQNTINSVMRCTPDIAMNADPLTGVSYLVNGSYIVVGGTSIVAPSMAGLLACLCYKQFILPKLYSVNSSCYHDIITGSNGQYSASKGYDKCTGLGSINGNIFSSSIIQTIKIVKKSIVQQNILQSPIPTKMKMCI